MSENWSDWDESVLQDVVRSLDEPNADHKFEKDVDHMETEEETSDNEPLSKYMTKSIVDADEKQLENVSSDYSSDDIPLSMLKQTHADDSRHIAYSSSSVSGDDTDDPDYVLSSEEMSADSSDTEHSIKNASCVGNNPSTEADFRKACAISENEHALYAIAVKWHTKRLNNLLDSRALKTDPVPSNGDCFIASVLKLRRDLPHTVTEFRQQIANHLLEQKKHYMGFLPTISTSNSYRQRINKLRRPGHWSDDVADLLPLAVCNMTNQPISILTSRHSRQVIHIKPSMSDSSNKPITLAYICIPGKEHYDPCIPIQHLVENCDSHDTKKTPRKQCTDLSECGIGNKNSPSSSKYDSTDGNAKAQATPKKKTSSYSTTPRKSAFYISPKLSKKTRKRISKPETWKKNIKKQLRLSGKSYMNVKGNLIPQKMITPKNCSKCSFRCNSYISEEIRGILFRNFWQLGTYERQRDYIASCIEERDTKTHKYKNFARSYTLLVNGERVRVCKVFFLSTLAISEKKMRTALQKRRTGHLTQTDQRGRHSPVNKTPEENLAIVRKHIQSFPTVESHYTRKNSRRLYLSQDLSIAKMHCLYKEHCTEIGVKPVTEAVYRRVFNTEFNFYFFKPKKDQCELCHKYNQQTSSGSVDEALKNRYEEHQRMKEEARADKEISKENARNHSHIYAATFDLQAVLATPCSLVSQVYYKRKLSSYNLSFYSLRDQTGTCYLWNESHGGRGSSEIATCLLKQINSLLRSVRYVTFFSDSCTGQNRNKYVASALHLAVTSNPHIEVVEQKFFESGHTQMECDSMHAAIEHAKKKTSIFEPSQWDTVVQMARKSKPYKVVPMSYTEFLDFHQYADTFINFVYDVNGKRVKWLKIKVVQVRKEVPGFMFVKYDYSGDFITININRTKQRGRPSITHAPLLQPPRKYHTKLPISNKKKQDLLALCRSSVIPEVHHSFYEGLPSSSAVKESLPAQEDEDSD